MTLRFATFDDGEVVPGRVDQVSPLIRRVLADNPSKFTYRGTGTYLVGRGDAVVVVDPGPLLDSHRAALERALDGERVRAILVTHCHADHSPLAAWLRETSDAPTIAYGPHPRPAPGVVGADDPDGEDDDERDDDLGDGIKLEEATDLEFAPDVEVRDGDVAFAGGGLTITAVHTPGHTSNHTCFALAEESALFTGDHVMGWSTTVVSPPDGDMAAYVASLEKVVARADAVLWPTHGPPRRDGAEYVRALVDHRLAREAQVLAAVRAGVTTTREIVELLYADVRPELHKPARHSVLGHLVKLVDEGAVRVADGGPPRLRARFVPA